MVIGHLDSNLNKKYIKNNRYENNTTPPQSPDVSTFTCVSSCEVPGGQTWRRRARTGDTGRAGDRCVCGNDGSARRSGRISTHSLPSCSGTASHLGGDKNGTSLVNRQTWFLSYSGVCVICARMPTDRGLRLTGVSSQVSLQV